MNTWSLNCYELLLRPAQALPKLAQRGHWGLAACILALTTLLHTLTQAGSSHQPLFTLLPQLMVNGGGCFVLWMIFSLMISLSADLFGGTGRITDTMTGLGLAALPLVLLAPISALPNFLGQAGVTLQLLLSIGIGFWVLVLSVMGIQSAQKFSLDKAIGSLVISGMLVLGFSFLGLLTGISQLMLSIQELIA
ncbi:hypothetical protein COW36_16525 [bacterium (Candidatus Blackallbacteria) CG17_big_fil_post_rev_8_21_14_2_50_48_46]|uniref:Yip1 domain-containing protein n=1 Tax=bacterium (Candidatus Blackallbacteria) CG17_big_fil_post_rev_8_21_14_2_50_48_46 TaxID=2014261 RepID=A0A2M7G1P4_9BACT|nr:MAG: hypothetical protein COW64_06915 [bacterium (Candidatus Blackallbacteria) CG18_big_fil_WC_8_21_14_2_50_49_26]PIW15642.1 MAG: hypothetical protein COW36_16525 [bacterium (Candidatus Blackallbacteria) CG17_big_fil_post_rev_8_21_14_2_50_48_46]PIW48126.1 MAG: hypothetical protein COW20_10680 [bacterium (Candidatus Blackallbacteria) CG13_big_fil_rev_8_21_14_2_50_49_14]